MNDEQVARRDPEMAVLSALAHGQEEVGQAIAQTVMAAVAGLEAERVRLYVDLALSSLSEAARNALEALMQSGTYEYQSEFARKYVAQGRQEGLLDGEQAALLEVLDARGFQVDAAARQLIESCTDLEQLKIWQRKAITVRSVHELFDNSPTPKSPARGSGKSSRRAKAPRSRSKR